MKRYENRGWWQLCSPSWQTSEYKQGFPVTAVPVTQLSRGTRRVFVPEAETTHFRLPYSFASNTFFCLHRFPLVVWLTQSSDETLSQQIRRASPISVLTSWKEVMLTICIHTRLTHLPTSSWNSGQYCYTIVPSTVRVIWCGKINCQTVMKCNM